MPAAARRGMAVHRCSAVGVDEEGFGVAAPATDQQYLVLEGASWGHHRPSKRQNPRGPAKGHNNAKDAFFSGTLVGMTARGDIIIWNTAGFFTLVCILVV